MWRLHSARKNLMLLGRLEGRDRQAVRQAGARVREGTAAAAEISTQRTAVRPAAAGRVQTDHSPHHRWFWGPDRNMPGTVLWG